MDLVLWARHWRFQNSFPRIVSTAPRAVLGGRAWCGGSAGGKSVAEREAGGRLLGVRWPRLLTPISGDRHWVPEDDPRERN